MFDVDLMNRPGLQKIISKINVNSNSKKQEIVFGNLESDQKQKDTSFIEGESNKAQTSILSLIIATIILSIFLLVGFFRLNQDFKSPSVLSKYANYFQSHIRQFLYEDHQAQL